MKNHFGLQYMTGCIVVCAALLSCGDEKEFFQDIVPPEGANIKFLHAASDAAGIFIYMNDQKINSGASIGSATGYAGAFPVTNYAALPEGTSSLKILTPATTTTSETVLVTTEVSTESNRYYTAALAGIAPNYEVLLINDDKSAVVNDGNTYVRFVNLIHNSGNKVDVIATLGSNAPVTIANDVAFKEVIAFKALPPGDYKIELKDASTNALLATASATNRNLAGNRAYTLFARGQIGLAGGKAPTLDRMTNQ